MSLPLHEAKRRIAAINEALKAGYPRVSSGRNPSALAAAADSLGLPRQTVSSSLKIIERLHKITPDWGLEVQARGVDKIAPRAAADGQRQKDKIDELQRALKKAHREIAAAEDLRRAVLGAVEQQIEPPEWLLKPCAPGAPGMPMLLASDFQWGETIRPSELDGMNEFNVAVAQKRYKLLIQKTIDLSLSHMGKPKYPGIIYMRGGDMVSGDIHIELKETNELSSIPAVKSLVEAESAGISQLAEKFGRVHVLSVPGNHGRTTLKPQAKRATESNYDTLSAWMLEREFKGDKRITFITPDSGDIVFSVYGWRYLLTHGDKIGSSGGQGFIGPAATIARGMKKLVDYYASVGQIIDSIFLGHFHTSLELEWGFSNGSLPGYGEFAKMHRMKPSLPKQWLVFSHPDYGITARWPILLERQMKRTVPVDDLARPGRS